MTDTTSTRRNLLRLLLGIGGLAILGAAIWGGAAIARPFLQRPAYLQADLAEIHLVGGDVYLGRVVAADDTRIELANPAFLVPQSNPPNAQVAVQAMFADPYDLDGPVVIPMSHVLLIGVVAPNSAIRATYQSALTGH